jgi:hypothetical protein
MIVTAVSWLDSFDVPWLSAAPTFGTLPAGSSQSVSVSLDAERMAAGDYTATLLIYNNDADENPTAVPVIMHVRAVVYLPLIFRNWPESEIGRKNA